MPLNIIRNDITKVECDAIVNAANKTLLGGGGVDGAIHKAAGRGLLKECVSLHGCRVGEAKATKGYKLPAKYVIHTVGPVWRGGTHNESVILRCCYNNSLKLAKELGCYSVAFPLISTGVYGYPMDEGFRIAVECISSFLMENDMLVYIVVFNKNALKSGSKLFSEIDEYIDDNYVETHTDYSRRVDMNFDYSAPQACYEDSKPRGFKGWKSKAKNKADSFERACDEMHIGHEVEPSTQFDDAHFYETPPMMYEMPKEAPRWFDEASELHDDISYDNDKLFHQGYSYPEQKNDVQDAQKTIGLFMPLSEPKDSFDLEDTIVLDGIFDGIMIDESFSNMLLRKIDEKGMKDSECYKKANIDRKLFSKIRSNPQYKPSKQTAIAFAIALELPLDETQELLTKAGYSLSHSFKFDVIIEYFIKKGNYNIFEINEALFAYDQNLLGA